MGNKQGFDFRAPRGRLRKNLAITAIYLALFVVSMIVSYSSMHFSNFFCLLQGVQHLGVCKGKVGKYLGFGHEGPQEGNFVKI